MSISSEPSDVDVASPSRMGCSQTGQRRGEGFVVARSTSVRCLEERGLAFLACRRNRILSSAECRTVEWEPRSGKSLGFLFIRICKFDKPSL